MPASCENKACRHKAKKMGRKKREPIENFINSGRGDGMATSVTTQEFLSKDSCVAASNVVKDRGNVMLGVFVNADCVEK